MFVKTIAQNVPSVVPGGRQKGDRKSLLVEDDDDHDMYDDYEGDDDGDLTMEGSSHTNKSERMIRQTSLSHPSQHSDDGGGSQLSGSSSMHRRGGHMVGRGSKAVVGGVVGGSKAVVGGGMKGGKAVAGGVVGGSKAVVGGVGRGSKKVVNGVNQSATTITKGVDDVLNRSAKKFEDTLNRSASKVVGGVVGVGNSLLFRNSFKEDEDQQQDEHENTDFSESKHSDRGSDRGSENGGSARSLKVMKSGTSSRNLGASSRNLSCRNLLAGSLGNRNLFGRSRLDSDSKKDEADSGYGGVDNSEPLTPRSKASSKQMSRRRLSAFGAVPAGYTVDEQDKTSQSTTTPARSTVVAMCGDEIRSGRARAGSTASLNSSASDEGYGEAAPSHPIKTAGKKTSRRRASALGAVPGGYVASEEMPVSIDTVHVDKKQGAQLVFGVDPASEEDDSVPPPLPPKPPKKANRRRASTADAVMEDIGARSDEKPAASKTVTPAQDMDPESPSKNSKKKVSRQRSSARGTPEAVMEAIGARSDEKPVTAAQDMDAESPSKNSKKKVSRQRSSARGTPEAIMEAIVARSDEKPVTAAQDMDAESPSKNSKKKVSRQRSSARGTAKAIMEAIRGRSDEKPVTAAQDMDAELPSKNSKKKVSRQRSSARGATPDGMPKEPIASAGEEMGHASCDGGVSPGKISKKRVGRGSGTGAVLPSGHVAELVAKMSRERNDRTASTTSKAKKASGKENDVKEEQPGKEDEAVPTTAAPTPKQKKTKAKNQPEKDDEATPATSAPTGTAKNKKSSKAKTKGDDDGDGDAGAAPNPEMPKPKKSSKKGATTDAAEGAGTPANLNKPKLAKDKSKSSKARKFKLSKEQVDSLRDFGQQETIEVNGKKKVIKMKVKRKGKTTGVGDDGEKSVNGGRVGAMNPMNMFKKSGTDGSGNPAKTSKMGAAVGGMFKRRPSLSREMSSRSLRSVSGRFDDDKSVRSTRSTRSRISMRSLRSTKSGGGVFGKAKTWLMKPRGMVGSVTGNNDTCGGVVDDDLSNGNMSAELKRIRQSTMEDGLPSETTAEASEGPPMTIFAIKCSKSKQDVPPAGRGAIIQKQWLAGGTNFDNKTRRKISMCDDDSDDDTSHHVKEDENDDAAEDDMSEISFIDPPLTRLPMPTNPSQPSEVEFWKRVCDERNKRYGTKHRLTIDAYLCKGNAELCSQDYKAATKSLLKAVSYSNILYGDSHPRVARGLHLLGAAACFHGELPLAEESTRNAFEMRRNTLGVCHVDTIDTFANLGMIYHKMQNYPEARRIFSELVQLRKAIYGQPHHSIAFANRSLAQVFVGMGDKDKARKYYVKALRTFDKLQMTRVLDETEADMTKFDIEIPLKVEEEAASVPAKPEEPPEECRMVYV